MKLSDCHNIDDFRKLAKKKLPSPIFNYIDGGADDETSSDNIRVICPIITNSKVKSGFRDKLGERFYEFPATGHFYNFDDTRVEHGVFNESDQDRYALIFTVIGVSNMKEWDRAYYKNKKYWKAWSSGI